MNENDNVMDKQIWTMPNQRNFIAGALARIAALEAENAKLREALKWAWDNLEEVSPYPDEAMEFDKCVVCGKPEYKHAPDCELAERMATARALLAETGRE